MEQNTVLQIRPKTDDNLNYNEDGILNQWGKLGFD